MTRKDIPHPRIVSREEWLAAPIKHLEHEKELTRHRDRVTAERRRLPMAYPSLWGINLDLPIPQGEGQYRREESASRSPAGLLGLPG
jgi:Bacterial protein of unknown function (DUF899)